MKKISPKKHMIKCSDIEPQLFNFIQQELGPVQTTVITEHLKKCEKCKESLRELKKSLKTLEDFGINKPPEHLTENRKKRIKFAYMHPFLNFCYIHHVIISLIVVIITLLAIIFMIRNTSLIKEKEAFDEYPINLNLSR